MKLLLHACCGPCSLEPVRLLQQEGHRITIAFANPNIQPFDEYNHRLDTLRTWALSQGIDVVELTYDIDGWEQRVGALEEQGCEREDRCRACYRMRLEHSARYAHEHGFEALSTTLAVSPYQFSEACHEELASVCAAFGLACIWQDFRPYYPQATTRSRELGMYRQNYCGCRYSKAEAQAEREQRRKEKAEREQQRQAQIEQQRSEREAKQKAYNHKQELKRKARDAYRASR